MYKFQAIQNMIFFSLESPDWTVMSSEIYFLFGFKYLNLFEKFCENTSEHYAVSTIVISVVKS